MNDDKKKAPSMTVEEVRAWLAESSSKPKHETPFVYPYTREHGLRALQPPPGPAKPFQGFATIVPPTIKKKPEDYMNINPDSACTPEPED
jgi:hypothetical protein